MIEEPNSLHLLQQAAGLGRSRAEPDNLRMGLEKSWVGLRSFLDVRNTSVERRKKTRLKIGVWKPCFLYRELSLHRGTASLF